MAINVARFGAMQSLAGLERQRLDVGIAFMSLLWQAGTDTGIFNLEEVRQRGRCLLLASTMLAALHHLGYRDARLLRCGATRTTIADDGSSRWITAGHPAAPRDTPFLNAHVGVQCGRYVFDPSFLQFQEPGDHLVHAAVLECKPRFRFHLHGHGKVDGFARAGWWSRAGHSTFVLFNLPRQVARATRDWQSRPDARPELRQALLERMLDLLHEHASASALPAAVSGRRFPPPNVHI